MPNSSQPGAEGVNYPNYILTDGTPATGIAQDAGGAGAIGWFSSIVKNIRLAATSLAQFTFDGSGDLKVLNTVAGAVVSGTNPLPVNLPTIGIGVFASVPTNGTPTTPVAIGTVPAGAVGIELYLPASSSVSGNIAANSAAAAAQIAASPSVAPVYDNASFGKIAQINVGPGLNVFLSAVSGTVLFRWI